MAIIRINRVPKYNQTEDRYEQNIKVLGPSGDLVSQLNILETKDVPAISNSMSALGGGIFVENLTSSIIKDKLQANLNTAPLFDTPLFTKNIESAYTQMYERHHAGLEPDHIYVEN